MNFSTVVIILIMTAWAVVAYAATEMPATNPGVNMSTAPISMGTMLSPGSYVASIAPTLNSAMAGRLKKALASHPGIKDADASSTDSTVHFTVKDHAKLRAADLQQLVSKIDSGAVMTTPVLENSTTPKPGL